MRTPPKGMTIHLDSEPAAFELAWPPQPLFVACMLCSPALPNICSDIVAIATVERIEALFAQERCRVIGHGLKWCLLALLQRGLLAPTSPVHAAGWHDTLVAAWLLDSESAGKLAFASTAKTATQCDIIRAEAAAQRALLAVCTLTFPRAARNSAGSSGAAWQADDDLLRLLHGLEMPLCWHARLGFPGTSLSYTRSLSPC